MSVPEYTRKYVSLPTKGSVMILNARAENGCVVVGVPPDRSSPVLGLSPSTGGTSNGDGRYSTTASSSIWTPLFLKSRAAEHRHELDVSELAVACADGGLQTLHRLSPSR